MENTDKFGNDLTTARDDSTNAQIRRQGNMSSLPSIKQEIALAQTSKWANRFMMAAIVQGALAAGLTSYLLASGVGWLGGAEASRIVAAGGAGTWLTVGYLVFIMLGPIAVAVTALFYQHLEAHLQTLYSGWPRILAWLHLVLMNVGVVGATWLMISAGFRGGVAALPVSQGGLGWTSLQVHENIMQYYPPYIAAFIAVAILGALAGGLGYVVVWRRSLRMYSRPLKP